MPSVERSSDIVEERSETAFVWGGGALGLFVLGALFFFYGGETLRYLSYVLILLGLGCIGYAIYSALLIRKVQSFGYECPYCKAKNRLAAEPEADFTCIECHRMIPVQDRKVLPVHRVVCGYCHEASYYSDKTLVLLCEHCNHEIPITRGDGSVAHSRFAVQEDTRTYELTLTAFQHGSEELISCLQRMLALNRNQVKDMLTSLPCVLLTGIPKKKAEMLAAQLAANGAAADYKPIG